MSNTKQNSSTSIEDRIREKTDLTIAHGTEVSASVGGLAFKDMGQVMEFSKLMSVAGQAVPKHLRGQPGACMAVSLQALNWRMDPFAVANKSYSVNDRVAYEAQLIHAVIEQRAPIKGRLKGGFEGEGAKRVCVLRAVSAEDGEEIVYRSPEIGSITTKNSPLWKSDPDQQLWYYSARAMCRRHFPDVLLGVYEREEIEQAPRMRDVTPDEPKAGGLAARAAAAREAARQQEEPEAEDQQQVEDADTIEGSAEDGAGPDENSFEFAEGRTAAEQGAALEDCPYEDGDERFNWTGGWYSAEEKARSEEDEA